MKRYVRSVLASCVVIGAGAVLGGCGTPQQREARALDRAERYLAEGKLEKARVELSNALQLAPNDAEARYRFGRYDERIGNLVDAAKFYQGALGADADHVPARAAVARIALMVGAQDKALELVAPGLEKHPDSTPLLTVRAGARARQGDTVGAVEDAEHAHRVDPRDENAIAVLAGLYVAGDQAARAASLLVDGIKANPASTELRLVLAQVYATHAEEEKAETLLREIITLKPDDAESHIRLARLLLAKGQAGEAERVLRAAAAAHPKDKALEDNLIAFLAAQRGRPAAEAELKASIARAARDDFGPQLTLARFYAAGGEIDKAEATFAQVVAKAGTHADGIDARNAMAELALGAGRRDKARALITEVLAASPRDAAALLMRASLALQDGSAQAAIADLRSVLRDQPNSLPALRLLAHAYAANGEIPLAEESLQRAMDASSGDSGAGLELAQLLLQTGRADRAKTLLDRLVTAHPSEAALKEARFRAAMASGDFAAARATAEAMIAAGPASPMGHLFLGLVNETEGKVEPALAEYRRSLDEQPAAVEPLEAAARLLLARHRESEAFKLLDEAAARTPTLAAPLGIKASMLLATGHPADAEVAARAALGRDSRWWLPYATLAQIGVARGDAGGAIALLREAVGKVAEPNRVRATLASLEETHGRVDEAIADYEAAARAAPGDYSIANNLAMLLVTYRKDPDSLKRAGALVQSFQSALNPAFLDTYGWVALKQGDSARALAALEKASVAAPQASDVRYHLAMAQLAAGQKGEAGDNLRRVVADGHPFVGLADAKAALAQLAAR